MNCPCCKNPGLYHQDDDLEITLTLHFRENSYGGASGDMKQKVKMDCCPECGFIAFFRGDR